jgi:uncharacterized membrane protein
MAAFAYVLPPATGLIAFLTSRSARARRHGLQSVAFGTLWPVALYLAAALSARAAQVTFIAGAALWIGLLALTAAGRDAHLPGTGRWLEFAAASSPRERPPAGPGAGGS